jgi:hypothetical protein
VISVCNNKRALTAKVDLNKDLGEVREFAMCIAGYPGQRYSQSKGLEEYFREDLC